MELLQNITKTRSADKRRQMSRKGVKIQPKSKKKWTPAAGAQQKTMLKNIAQQIKNTQTMTHKSTLRTEAISRVAPPRTILVAQTSFGHQKWVPSAPKVLPMVEN